MGRLAPLVLAAALAGCAGDPGAPRANLGVVLTPDGVRVVPRVSVPLAPGATVTVRP